MPVDDREEWWMQVSTVLIWICARCLVRVAWRGRCRPVGAQPRIVQALHTTSAAFTLSDRVVSRPA